MSEPPNQVVPSPQGSSLQPHHQPNLAYIAKRVGLRLILPGVAAWSCHEWAWNMVAQEEFAIAFVLLVAFAILGVFAISGLFDSPRRPRITQIIKLILGAVLVLWAIVSGIIFWGKWGDKPWTSVLKKVSPVPAPTLVPNPSPSPSASPSPTAPVSPTVSPTPRTQRSPRKRSVGLLTEEEKWVLRQLNSNKHAHASFQKSRISKEEIKSVLSRRLTERGRGLRKLVSEVRKRGISFRFTSEVEQEIRTLAAKHGNKSIDDLIAVLRGLGAESVNSVPTVQTNRTGPNNQYPFREKPAETVVFIFGSNIIQMPRAVLREGPRFIPLQNVLGDPLFNSVSVYLKDDKPLVDVKMWGGGGDKGDEYEIEVAQNEFSIRPSDWDRNFNDHAFEVVDQNVRPILQVYYKTTNEIVINGVFRSLLHMVYASDETGVEMRLIPKKEGAKPTPPSLKRMFQYPSIKHFGEFSPDWKPH